MNILHVYKTSFPESIGGIESFIHEISSKLVDEGHSVTVLTTSTNKTYSINIDGYKIIFVKSLFVIASTPFSISYFYHYYKLSKNADIINFHYPWPFMDLVCILVPNKAKKVITYHSDIIRQKFLFIFYNPLRKLFFNKINRIIVTSKNYLQSSKILSKNSKITNVIPIGLDEKNYFNNLKIDNFFYWKKILPMKFILFVGVLRYYKGLDLLLSAIKNLDINLVIAGSGPLEIKLKNRVKIEKITNVIFTGKISNEDKSSLISLCHCAVFPSNMRSEAFGVFLVEAAIFGKPLISSELGTGTSFINAHNESGLVIQPNSLESLRSSIIQIYNNPQLTTLMGKNSRERYKKYFTSDIMTQEYIKLYKNLIY